jgi:hypothetical protein
MLSNASAGFQWQGEVNTLGEVTETPLSSDGEQIAGWYGRVISTHEGAQYDDYLKLLPDGTGEVGIDGTDEAIQAEIERLRDGDIAAHFWGTLVRDVPDYGGRQLRVDQVQPERSGLSVEGVVEGWEGIVASTPQGAQFDDYLQITGEFPVRYGIESPDAEVIRKLDIVRDTLTPVQVWGTLTCGVPDVNGCQLGVTRLLMMGEPLAPTPHGQSPEGEGEPIEGWSGGVYKLPPGNQFGQYFVRDDGERFGIGTADETLRQQINTATWTGAEVRILGTLYIGVPAMEARYIELDQIEIVSDATTEARNLAPFAEVSASSQLPPDRYGTYFPYAAIDGLQDTAWVEGASGSGVGEWIMLTFPGPVKVWQINVDVGFDKNADLFAKNNRIKRATLVFSTAEHLTLDFEDAPGLQKFVLARAPGPGIETTYVRMIIDEVYPGTRYDDTCLAEIEVWGSTK